jgi:hypothetical protein
MEYATAARRHLFLAVQFVHITGGYRGNDVLKANGY